jgi:hypothetical protein
VERELTISSKTSPAANVSPSFSFQLAIPPSVIVGDIAGMRKDVVAYRTWTATTTPLPLQQNYTKTKGKIIPCREDDALDERISIDAAERTLILRIAGEVDKLVCEVESSDGIGEWTERLWFRHGFGRKRAFGWWRLFRQRAR